jgi:hypothetical protein
MGGKMKGLTEQTVEWFKGALLNYVFLRTRDRLTIQEHITTIEVATIVLMADGSKVLVVASLQYDWLGGESPRRLEEGLQVSFLDGSRNGSYVDLLERWHQVVPAWANPDNEGKLQTSVFIRDWYHSPVIQDVFEALFSLQVIAELRGYVRQAQDSNFFSYIFELWIPAFAGMTKKQEEWRFNNASEILR